MPKDTQRPALLLVHGAWHGPWCWEELIPVLSDQGWRVHTVALPSCAEKGAALPASAPGLYDDAAAIDAEIAAVDGPVIIVAHSYGGAPTTQASLGIESVVHLIYLAAYQLDIGESARTSRGADPFLPIPTRSYSPPHPDADLYTDVPAHLAERAIARLSLQSDSSRSEPVTRTGWRPIPSSYVICDRDGALPPALQAQFATRAGATYHLDTGHSPFYSRPRQLAALINSIADAVTPSAGRHMTLIALEEHYADAELLELIPFDLTRLPARRRNGLLDVTARIADMDAAGIAVQVLSALPPGAQELTADDARRVNERVQRATVARFPRRFAAFATLPLTDPRACAAELEHSVEQLGFVGAMVYGMAGGRFLDHPSYTSLLESAASLEVPIYLHPGFPPKGVADIYYSGLTQAAGHALASHAYGWHYETSLHALRLVASGVFERLPQLQIVLGHLGEGLPFHFARIERMFASALPHLTKPVGAYLRQHFWITTSGYFDDGPFMLTRNVFGDERLMFSVDYPFSDNIDASQWFARLDLSSAAREAIGQTNAATLLRLPYEMFGGTRA